MAAPLIGAGIAASMKAFQAWLKTPTGKKYASKMISSASKKPKGTTGKSIPGKRSRVLGDKGAKPGHARILGGGLRVKPKGTTGKGTTGKRQEFWNSPPDKGIKYRNARILGGGQKVKPKGTTGKSKPPRGRSKSARR